MKNEGISRPHHAYISRLVAGCLIILCAGMAIGLSTILYILSAFDGTMAEIAAITGLQAAYAINMIGFLFAALLRSSRVARINTGFLIALLATLALGAIPCIAIAAVSPGYDRNTNCGCEEVMYLGLANALTLAAARLSTFITLASATALSFPFIVGEARNRQLEPLLAEIVRLDITQICLVRAPNPNWPHFRNASRVTSLSEMNPTWLGGETMPRYYLFTSEWVTQWKYHSNSFERMRRSTDDLFAEYCAGTGT